MVLLGSTISDIHFGAIKSDKLFYQLNEAYLNILSTLPVLDYIILAGDTYDRIISLNSEHATYSFMFFERLANIARTKNTKIRVILGTKGHDEHQLNNLHIYENDQSINFRVIRVVEEEMLFNNFRVLYLPEEYLDDADYYYDGFLNVNDNTYDAIFGHGMIDRVAFEDTNATHIKNAPVFNLEELMRICIGPIQFGHIHDYHNYYNKFYYNGSFTSWMHDKYEELEKGSLLTVYDTITKKYLVERLINPYADRFMTVNLTEQLKYMEFEEMIKLINNIFNDNSLYKLKIKLDDLDDLELYKKIKLLRFYFNKYDQITIDYKSKKLNTIVKEKDESDNKYDYIFINNGDLNSIISRYIYEEFNVAITPDEIKSCLSDEVIDN